MTLRIARPVKWALLALSAAFLFSLALLPVSFMVDKGVSWWVRLLLAAMALGCIAAVLVVEDVASGETATRERRGLKLAAALLLAVQLAFGFLTDAVGLLQPRGAVEDETGLIQRAMLRAGLVIERIEKDLRRVSSDVDSVKNDTGAIRAGLGIGEPSWILQKIGGTWGEDGCRVVRSFVLRDRSLNVVTLRGPAGMTKLSWSFTIWTGESTLNQRSAAGWRTSSVNATEREGLFPGQAVVFTYLTDGANERLVWDGQTDDQQPVELQRCENVR